MAAVVSPKLTAVVLYDRGTKDLGCFAKATKSAAHTVEALQAFAGTHKAQSFYCDNAAELAAAAAPELGWMHPTSTPGVPQINGLTDRMARSAKEGGRANLVQAGFSVTWFELAAPDYCFTKVKEEGRRIRISILLKASKGK